MSELGVATRGRTPTAKELARWDELSASIAQRPHVCLYHDPPEPLSDFEEYQAVIGGVGFPPLFRGHRECAVREATAYSVVERPDVALALEAVRFQHGRLCMASTSCDCLALMSRLRAAGRAGEP